MPTQWILLLLLPFIFSCSSQNNIVLGKTSESSLLSTKGSPIKTHQERGIKLFYYENHNIYQSHSGVVQGHYREPIGAEKNLDYWRDKWSGKEKTYQLIGEGKNQVLEISIANGSSIIFDEALSRIVRVMEFRVD